LSLLSAFATEGGYDFAVDIEHLDAMIVRVRYDDTIRRTDGDVVRMFQLARSVTQTAKLAHESTIRLEHLEHRYLIE